MATEVGSVLQVNFVQGEDYLQNVLVYEARAANAAANAKNSEIIAENAKNIAITKADEAANSAVQAKNSENIAKQSEINALNSATQAKESENNAKEYSDKTEAHYNQFYNDLSRIENDLTVDIQQVESTLTNGLNHLTNTVNVQYRSLDDSRKAINEWIELHDGAFSLVDFGLYDNNGEPIVDNDDTGFGGKMYMPITDDTLTLNGIPADAEAVGRELSITNGFVSAHQTALSRIDCLLESWSDNFTQAEVAMADSDGDYLLDNDDEELLSGGIRMVTDNTLTVTGVPADAYAVGQALQSIRDLIATYHP